MQEKLRGDLTESMAAIEATIATCLPDVTAAAEAVVECYRAGGKVLIAGNGGSAGSPTAASATGARVPAA